MARIRTIKPEFWSSEQVVDCSPLARLLFIGLWNFCDDSGIHPRSPRRLKMLVFPADDFTADQVDSLIDELVAANLVTNYLVNAKCYLKVTGWMHQRIDHPSYRYPLPTGEIPCGAKNTEKNGALYEDSTKTLRTLDTERNRTGIEPEPELKGIERNLCSTSIEGEGDQKEISIDDSVLDAARKVGGKLGRSKSENDRALVLKASWLALNRFSEHWLHDAAEAVTKAKSKPAKPYGYFLTCLRRSCKKQFHCNLDYELAQLTIPNELLAMPPPGTLDLSERLNNIPPED